MLSNTENYKNIIVPIIHKYLPNIKIILYGSRARCDDKPGSDIDIALDAGKKLERRMMNEIIGDLEDSSLPIMFDIIDFHAVSEQMQKEIMKDGVIWQK